MPSPSSRTNNSQLYVTDCDLPPWDKVSKVVRLGVFAQENEASGSPSTYSFIQHVWHGILEDTPLLTRSPSGEEQRRRHKAPSRAFFTSTPGQVADFANTKHVIHTSVHDDVMIFRTMNS